LGEEARMVLKTSPGNVLQEELRWGAAAAADSAIDCSPPLPLHRQDIFSFQRAGLTGAGGGGGTHTRRADNSLPLIFNKFEPV
jgi:hypothetical protein